MTQYPITMAKASQAELDALRKFFADLREKADDNDVSETALGEWLIGAFGKLDRKISLERILLGYETLLANACDPNVDHLEWNPEIKRKFEQAERSSWALSECQRLNQLRNDKDGYLYEVVRYSFGERGDKPLPEDFGVVP